MKKNNPHVPILIREGTGTLPRVYARYGMSIQPSILMAGPWPRLEIPIKLTNWIELGQEKTQSLEGMLVFG